VDLAAKGRGRGKRGGMSTLIALSLSLALPQLPASDLEDLVRGAERVWLCPAHPELHHDREGRCDICGRPLEERFVTWRWACPMHPELASAEKSPCPVCEMERVVTTVEVVWRCPDHPEELRTAPGSCESGGTALRPELRSMAHGDHNPRHGGLFFMAADRFHHLEGALSEGRFRLYLYDSYTEPLPASAATARVGDARLDPTPDGAALEIPFGGALPAEITAHVDFGAGEQRFDFIFTEESVPPSLPELRMPDSVTGLLAELERRDERVRELMRLGAWTELYVPALQAKDLALALAEREPRTDPQALRRLVRGAWLLDLYGDVADRRQVERAYALFSEGWRALRGER